MRRRTLLTAVPALSVWTATTSATSANAQPRPDALKVWVPTGDFASSSFVRVPRAAPDSLPVKASQALSVSGVRGGHASGQLAVAGPAGIKGLRVRVTPLTANDAGTAAIPASDVQVRYPSYVPDGQGGLIADPLIEAASVDVGAGDAQPVWFTFTIPDDADAGSYRGQVVLEADDADPVRYDLDLRVADVTLPAPPERGFHLNVWLQPDTIADHHGLEPWSDDHVDAMRPYLRDLAQRGQRVVNTTITEDPWRVEWPDGEWRSQTRLPYRSPVDWTYDGHDWVFGFDNWDRLVERQLAAGIGPYIHAYGLLGFRRDFLIYTDSRTGETIDKQVGVGSAVWADAWSAFLAAFEKHVRDRGWLDSVHLGFDERPADLMRQALDLTEKAAPALARNGFAGSGTAEADPFTYDLALNYSDFDDWSQELIDRRRAEGKLTSFYTWSEPAYPNTVTHAAPLGSRVLPWQSAKSGLDGYLRWAYNSWPEEPYHDPIFNPEFRQGDEYLVYPGKGGQGPVSKIGWELFRDGQEDFTLLEQLAARDGADNPVRREALNSVDPAATPDATTHKALLEARAAVVEELQRLPRQ
ncbi:DUF4091 domain-containing protein [Streptomyces oceani]|uniref:DUF4091 domain-containing protein n=1 Tax=Streptomyces oceani TaxID=1075402 RepID=UPI000872360B|nr:DUF4091 domain-containing protein [Streptomyces oceani]